MKFNILYDEEDIKKVMVSTFKKEHSLEMSNAVLELLKDYPEKIEVLVKIAQGLYKKPTLKEGDEVYVKYTDLPTWRYDKDEMKRVGLIDEHDTVTAVIKNVHLYAVKAYVIKYNCIQSETVEQVSDAYDVTADSVEKTNNFIDDEPELTDPVNHV